MSAATGAVAEQLGMPEGAPVLVLDRVVYTIDGRPVEWRVGQCNPADMSYAVELN